MPDGSVTVHLGIGRRAEAGRVGAGVGFNAYLLRTSRHAVLCAGNAAPKTGDIYDICVTKVQLDRASRRLRAAGPEREGSTTRKAPTRCPATRRWSAAIIRYATLEEAKGNPNFAHENEGDVKGALIDKVGYGPIGEPPGKDESFFPDAWRYDHKDVSSHDRCRTSGAWRST